MNPIKMATAQFENKSGDKAYNLSVIDELARKASIWLCLGVHLSLGVNILKGLDSCMNRTKIEHNVARLWVDCFDY
jgi:hypothetical protein